MGAEHTIFESLPIVDENNREVAIERARFEMLLSSVINSHNTDDENEARRRVIDWLTEKGMRAHVIEQLFRLGGTGALLLNLTDSDIDMIQEAVTKLGSKTHKVECKEGPIRSRYRFEEGAFEEFKAVIEMIIHRLSGTQS